MLLPLPKTNIKMLLSESSEINLPSEVWIQIWSFLDFIDCQKICTLVSKEWFNIIRNSTRLSGEMIFNVKKQKIKDINNALSRWPKLKVLHLFDCSKNSSRLRKLLSHWEKVKKFTLTTDTFGINLTEHALIRKIVVPESMHFEELHDWGKATEVWFDPKNWTPANLSNVKSLEIYVNFFPKDVEIVQIGNVLMNVEELFITDKSGPSYVIFNSEFILGFQNFIFGFKKLKTVSILVIVNITDFLDLLLSVASLKGLKIWLRVCIVHDHLEERYVQGVFEEGFKIIEKTYSIESTHVGISDSQYYFKIEKNFYNKPVLCDDG